MFEMLQEESIQKMISFVSVIHAVTLLNRGCPRRRYELHRGRRRDQGSVGFTPKYLEEKFGKP